MMKKYLMTGMAAVALSAAFTSCSNNEVFDPERSQTADQVTMAYNQAFVKTFGQPAANQDWGFGTRANTRAANTNANQWADPQYGGWKVPDPLTDEQKAVVKKYFQTHKNPTYEDPQWTNYFVQQVYKGGTDPMQGDDYSPEVYKAANGQTDIESGKHMDHLVAVDGDFQDHINNFNQGDCGLNPDVLNNGHTVNESGEGTHHADKIMLMVNSTTKSFGYANSNGDVIRTNYTGLVSAQTIIDAMGAEADCLKDGWNRSFMGFDFEQMVDEECYAVDYNWTTGVSTPKYFTYKNGDVYEYNGKPVRMLSNQTNRYCGTSITVKDTELYINGELNTEFIDGLLSEGYLPVQDKEYREWTKIGGCADGYYSDWIVTLTEAKQQQNDTPTIPTPDYTIRVIGEDLSASDATDFDFNDVVFDVALNFNGKTWVKLQAAGGTLPLIIGVTPADDQDYPENEVHNRFGGYSTSTMINTNASAHGKAADGVDPVEIELAQAYEDARDIPVYVKKNGTWVELTAVQGEPASKIGVATTFQWVDERVSLRERYPRFSEWVTQGNGLIWY